MKLMHLKSLLFVTLFLVFGMVMGQAQTGNIQGNITDENGIYVPGANIMISELSKGTISDFDGRFTLVNVPEGTHTLQISFLGYSQIPDSISNKFFHLLTIRHNYSGIITS